MLEKVLVILVYLRLQNRHGKVYRIERKKDAEGGKEDVKQEASSRRKRILYI